MKTSKKNVFFTTSLTVLGITFGLFNNVSAGEYIRVSPDLDIYYEEVGTGTPIIFIPGWSGTTEFFHSQIEYFSNNYRVIVYDPRGQGRSSKTLENNHYPQHGADLKALMDALMLEDVVLVGHSLGCADAHTYFRAFGTENVKAFVCIDQPPKTLIEQEGDWGMHNFPESFKTFNDNINHNRLQFTRGFTGMIKRTMTEEEINWMVDELIKTPTHVAIALWLDGNITDFTSDAKMIDGKIPVLYVLAEHDGYTETAKAWLTENTPNTQIEAFGYHAMFWEFPDRFNAVVDAFLEKLK